VTFTAVYNCFFSGSVNTAALPKVSYLDLLCRQKHVACTLEHDLLPQWF
jgi:hypothetical protein